MEIILLILHFNNYCRIYRFLIETYQLINLTIANKLLIICKINSYKSFNNIIIGNFKY